MYEQTEAMEHPLEMDPAEVEAETPSEQGGATPSEASGAKASAEQEGADSTGGEGEETSAGDPPADPGSEASPQPAVPDLQAAEATAELEALRGELTRMREELQQHRERLERLGSEYTEFRTLYPDTDPETLSDEVWSNVKRGVPIAAAVALWEKKKQYTEGLAARQSAENRRRSTGSVTSGASGYLSPEEVRSMSPEEVRENYQSILKSMSKWK